MKIKNKFKSLNLLLFLFAFVSMSFLWKEDKPTLFIIGDSTVRNGQGNGTNGQWGWGSFIDQYFDLSRINIKNKALGGTSTRTFYNNPQLWQQVLDSIQPGDFVIMQFGHNDSSPIVDTLRARGTIKGNGDEFQEVYNPLLKQHEVIYSYGFYLRRFIKNVQDKGAVAIVCSPIPRNSWEGDRVRRSDYALWAVAAAQQSGAFFIPLQDVIIGQYEVLGKSKVETVFFDSKDATHTIKEGALLNAKLVAAQLKAQKNIDLKKFMK